MEVPQLQILPAEDNALRLVGELDMETVAVFETAVTKKGTTSSLTLDLAELSFIDSSGFHAMERYARTLNGAAPLVVTNIPRTMRRLFAIVGLDKHEAIRLT